MHQFSANDLTEKFKKGELRAEAIVEHFLQRIKKYDPEIGAFIKVFEERALIQAKNLDERKDKGLPLGKLAAVPVALKDNMHVKGEISTCGSKFLTNYKAPFNATVTELLEEEDAIIIGKTNCDEFAMGSSTENSAIQRTYNPWNLKCTPGGSSGGSAAAVAARLVPLSLGSDTGGSIRQPASLCGIVGFKPTYGRVSRYGLVAFASSFDQIGPFANSCQDTALIMEVIGKHCHKDSTSFMDPGENYLSSLNGKIQGLKIGVPWQFLSGLAQEPKKHFENGIDRLKKLGAEIVEVDLQILKYALATYYILTTAEASTNLARFDGIRFGARSKSANTLDEVYDLSKEEGFGKEVKRRILLGTFVLSSGYQDAYYRKAQKIRTLIIEHYKKAFEKCDCIATPVSPFAAFEVGSIMDPLQMYLEDIYTISINLAGLPAISVPSALTQDGKPIGLQLIGPQKKDKLVLEIAHLFEKGAEKYPTPEKYK